MPSLGTDPEFFILDPKGKPVPAHRFFPPTTDKLAIDPTWSTEIKAFRDGYAVELNVPAAGCRDALNNNVFRGLAGIRAKLPPGYTLTSMPTVEVDLEDFRKDAPEDVKNFGCKPSRCAYTGNVKIPPLDAWTHPYRYAGGHMHISEYRERLENTKNAWVLDSEQVALFVRVLDLYVGVPLAAMFNSPENFMRREWYGQAGEYRQQKYSVRSPKYTPNPEYGKPPLVTWEEKPNQYVGVEYRTPSPEVWNSPVVGSFVAGAVRSVFNYFLVLAKSWDKGKEDAIRHAINTGEGALALVPEGLYDEHYAVGWNNLFYTRDAFRNAFIESDLQYKSLQQVDPTFAANGWRWYRDTKGIQ